MVRDYAQQVMCFSSIKPRTLLEIGAFDGAHASYLSNLFDIQTQDLFLVEPNPDRLNYLKEKFPNAHLFGVALSDSSGKRQLNKVISKSTQEVGGSSLKKRIDGWQERLEYSPVTVETMTGDGLMRDIDADIDLCIIDVEGASYEVLVGFSKSLTRIASLMIECEHAPVFSEQALYSDVAGYLASAGFQQMAFRYSYANQSDSVWIRSDLVRLEYPRPRRPFDGFN